MVRDLTGLTRPREDAALVDGFGEAALLVSEAPLLAAIDVARADFGFEPGGWDLDAVLRDFGAAAVFGGFLADAFFVVLRWPDTAVFIEVFLRAVGLAEAFLEAPFFDAAFLSATGSEAFAVAYFRDGFFFAAVFLLVRVDFAALRVPDVPGFRTRAVEDPASALAAREPLLEELPDFPRGLLVGRPFPATLPFAFFVFFAAIDLLPGPELGPLPQCRLGDRRLPLATGAGRMPGAFLVRKASRLDCNPSSSDSSRKRGAAPHLGDWGGHVAQRTR